MTTVARIAAVLAGAWLVASTLLSAIRTVVVPRATSTVITRSVFITMRRVFAVYAHERRQFHQRDRMLANYAPISLVLLPGVWVALVITGFTGIYWGTGIHGIREAFALSGSSVLTLGFATRSAVPDLILAFLEATLGLGLVALLISYLPSIYSSFARRESAVALLEARAGSPPLPSVMLARYARIGMESLDEELFARWEQWFVEVEESHTSLPALVFFRSPQPERSWITAAGCVLDTASIVASTIDRPHSPRADLCIRTGFLALRRIAAYFRIPFDPDPSADAPVSVTRREFDLFLVELEAAGIPIKADRDQAWRDFCGWRVNYDTVLVGLSKLVIAPPGRWSSDRPGPTPRVRVFGPPRLVGG